MTKTLMVAVFAAGLSMGVASNAFAMSHEMSAAREAFNKALDECEMKSNVDERNNCIDAATQAYREALAEQKKGM